LSASSYDATATTEIYTLSLHDALPILDSSFDHGSGADGTVYALARQADGKALLGGAFTNINGVARHGNARLNADGSLDTAFDPRSEEHTSELESRGHLVCRLLLEKKKK